MDAESPCAHPSVAWVLHAWGICYLCAGWWAYPADQPASGMQRMSRRKPALGNSHAQNACVCWEVRAEPLLVNWWHVECLWLPLMHLCLWALTGSMCLCCHWRIGSVWPSILRKRTADRLLHPQSLLCRLHGAVLVLCRQLKRSGWLFCHSDLYFFLFSRLICFNSKTQLRRRVFPVQSALCKYVM